MMPFGPLSDKGGSAPHDFERIDGGKLRRDFTVERIDGGKLRCTGSSWTDAVLARRGPVFCEPERPAHAASPGAGEAPDDGSA
jgi:hypothetical protein